MTPAEFYVSSDALVHLQVSTECLIARAVEQLAEQSRSKYDRQRQRVGLKCIMNIY